MNMLSSCTRAIVLPIVVLTAGCGVGVGTIGTLGTITELVRSARTPTGAPQPVQVTAQVQRVDARRQILQVETPDGRAGGILYDLGTVVVHDERPYPVTSLGPGDVVTLQVQEVAQNNLYASRIEVMQLVADEAEPATAPAMAQPTEAVAEPAPTEPAPAEPAPAPPVAAEPADPAVPQDPTAVTEPIEPAEPAEPAQPTEAAQPPAIAEALALGDPPAAADVEAGPAPELRELEGEVVGIDVARGMFQLRPAEGDILTVSLPYNAPADAVARLAALRSGDSVHVEVYPLSATRVELHGFR